MREFKTWRDPYDGGFSTCRPRKIQINEGLTVFVGCNGAGKTTLLKNLESELLKSKVPVKFFDNVKDGGGNSVGEALFNEDYALGSELLSSSEGETIRLNIMMLARHLHNFMVKGEYADNSRSYRLRKLFQSLSNEDSTETEQSNERWLLFDATDSGYSIDNVVELKELFNIIAEDAKEIGVTLYIIISANEYELASGEQCFDVNAGKYLTFKDYDDYKKFILKNRERKDKRMERAAAKQQSDPDPARDGGWRSPRG